jgi:hypothetical protein
LKGRGFTAEKLGSSIVSEGRGFSCAAQAVYFRHSEAAVAAEESAFLTLFAASSSRPMKI